MEQGAHEINLLAVSTSQAIHACDEIVEEKHSTQC